MHLVRSGAFAGFEKLVSRYGGNPIALIHEAGFTLAQFRHPNSYIAYEKMADLLERCAEVSNNPLFGLELSQIDNSTALGDLPITVAQQATVGEALKALNRHLYLVASGVHLQFDSSDTESRISLHFDFSSKLGMEQLIQTSVAITANILVRMTNIAYREIKLQLRQPEPVNRQPSTQYMGYDLEFCAAFNGLVTPANTFQQKTRIDEAAMQLHFEEQLNYLTRRYPGNLKDQTKELIGQLLPTGDCSIGRVAANLNMHPRVLQIKLRSLQTTYGQLLKETRQSIAEQHLRYNRMSITDLALNLGFADVSVFSRQFKSWTGLPPREWKRKF